VCLWPALWVNRSFPDHSCKPSGENQRRFRRHCGQRLPGSDHGLGNRRTKCLWGAGELAVRGPNVFRGYWKHPEDTKLASGTAGYIPGTFARMMRTVMFTYWTAKKEMINTGDIRLPRPNWRHPYGAPGRPGLCGRRMPDQASGEIPKASRSP